MIRIDRGQEPSALVTARSTRLSAAVKTYNRHGAGSRELSDTLVGYNMPTIKDALYLAQHKKCSWCELLVLYSSSPV